MRYRIGAIMMAVMLVSGSGCSALAVRLGLRTRLDSVPVTSLAASMVSRHDSSVVAALGPGQSARLVVVATTNAGERFSTVGAGNGKVAFDNYTIEATTVQVSKRPVRSRYCRSKPRAPGGSFSISWIRAVAR